MKRKIDANGTLTLPVTILDQMDLLNKDGYVYLEYIDGCLIISTSSYEDCIFCESTIALNTVKDKPVCSLCLDHLASIDATPEKKLFHNICQPPAEYVVVP